jgi:hypothetical protein
LRLKRGGRSGRDVAGAHAMRHRTRSLVIVNVCGCGERHVVLNQHVLPSRLQRLEDGALDLAGVLQREVLARCGVHGSVSGEHYPGGDRAVDLGQVSQNPIVLLRTGAVVVFLRDAVRGRMRDRKPYF